VEPSEIPGMVDEVPLLACLASRAEGTSVFRGVGELRVKESDRLALVARNLEALGVAARTEGDTLWVEGTERPPIGRVETAGDHRLAMAFAVLGTLPGARVALDDRDCVAVSYPSFFTDLRRILRRA
jgi:3-phosphoshikimate 1-carboxyvinyltransferase